MVVLFALFLLHEVLYCCWTLRYHLASCSVIKLLWLLLSLVYSLGSIALVFCTSIATISRRGVKEKLYFPGG